MKKFIIGFVLGAILSGVGVKAHETLYNDDDLMRIAKRIEDQLLSIETDIMIFCGGQ